MANSIPSTLEYPQVDLAVTGLPLIDSVVAPMAGCINYALNVVGCVPVVSQFWQNGSFSYAEATATPAEAVRWRVPLLSDAHTTYSVFIVAHKTSSGGLDSTLTVTSEATSDSILFTVNNHLPTLYSATLDVGDAGDGLDEIYIEVSSYLSNPVVVRSVTVQPDAVTTSSTLPSTEIDGAVGIGVNTLKPDYPLGANILKEIATGVNAMRARPEVLFNFSRLSDTVNAYLGGGTGADNCMQPIVHSTLTRLSSGDTRELLGVIEVINTGTAAAGYVSDTRFTAPDTPTTGTQVVGFDSGQAGFSPARIAARPKYVDSTLNADTRYYEAYYVKEDARYTPFPPRGDIGEAPVKSLLVYRGGDEV
jgi:hypothetical protein